MQTKNSATRTVWLVAAAGAVVLVGWYWLSVNPLPNDEEMIAQFQAHRAELNQLAQAYRAYRLPAGETARYWAEPPETQALMGNAGIKYIEHVGDLWLPNPYSAATGRKKDSLVRTKHDFDLGRRFGALYFRPADPRYFTRTLRYPTAKAIWKDFYYTPETPRIESGILMGPADSNGVSHQTYRVLASLNEYPSSWRRGECVMREIEPRWFIQMCRAS